MKHYRDTDGGVWGIGEEGDIDGDQSSLINPDWVLMTLEEYELFIHPPKTEEQLDDQKKSSLLAYWETIEVTINEKTFIANQNTCSLMDLKIGTAVSTEDLRFPAKYGFVTTNAVELQQVLDKVDDLLEAKKIELGIE